MQNNQGAGVGDRSRLRLFKVQQFDQKAIFLCQFCGGEECAHEDYLTNKKQPNAIEGLNSNWITDNILAMQRPSQRLIKKFDIYQKFKAKGIRTVLNLQEPGEHPFCGDGIIPEVGFSYVPEHFYRHGIHCFNQSWEDMTSTTFEHMMRIMNLFDMSLRDGGRISVHCHAGRGRTLLVICSWLIYRDRMGVEEVIKLAKERREGVLASRNQVEFLKYFHQQLQKRWISFSPSEKHNRFCQFVEWQSYALLGREKKRINSMSVVHYRIVRQLRILAKDDSDMIVQALISPMSIFFKTKWQQQCEQKLSELKTQMNKIHFKNLKEIKDPRLLTQLLFDFYDQFPSTLLTAIQIDVIKEITEKSSELSTTQILLHPSVVHSVGVETIATIMDFVFLLNELLKDGKVQKMAEEEIRQSKQMIQAQNSKIESNISEALFTRLSLLLLSKRKYFPQLFCGQNQRECKIYRYVHKITKIVHSQISYLTNFLMKLSEQLPRQYQELQRMIFKIKKVESNLFYLLKDGKYTTLYGEEKEAIYQQAKIKH